MPDSLLHWFFIYFSIGAITLPLLRLFVYMFHRKEAPSVWVDEVIAALEKEKSLKAKVKKTLTWVRVVISFCLIWPVALAVAAHAMFFDGPTPLYSSDEPRFTCQKESLIKQVDALEIEEANYVTDPLGRVPNVPFGHLHQGWINLLSQLEQSDELWMFKTKGWCNDDSNAPKYEKPRNVSSGFAVVRGKKVVAEFVCSSD